MKRLSFILLGLALLLFITAGSFWYYKTDSPSPLYAFASDRTGNGDIFLIDATGKLHQITQAPEADWDPIWHPNGRSLAFTSHRTGDSDIWVIADLETDFLRKTPFLPPKKPYNLTNHPAWDYSPTWSPSGQSIAFVSERDGDPEIFVQHLEETTAIQLTFNEEMDRLPIWSPDGKSIAFAAVRDGVEQIHRIRPDGTDEQIVTPTPLKGTSPAWSPDSQRLAFIGWDDAGRPGIYIIGPESHQLEQLYQSDAMLSSLSWSPNGDWLTFTLWEEENQELFALPITGGSPTRLSYDQAWDDFLVLNPQVDFTPPAKDRLAQTASAAQPAFAPQFAAGVNIADLSKAYLVNGLGFNWAKSYVNWATVEPQPGQYQWADPDNIVRAFSDQDLKILMRINGTPAWNRPANSHYTHPPVDLAHFAEFITQVAQRYKGQVAAYEIWNEPNLDYEWGYQSPDPAAYTELLQVAYTAIKQVDPEAIVIGGGLSTTGEGSPTAYGDLAFLQAMYDADAKGYFDAFGSHPYSFGHNPDIVNPYGLSFSRVTEQHAIMTANGDGETPIWITETGWVLQTSWHLDEHEAIGVTEMEQAEYVARAYQKAAQEWPFVEGLFLFNLDFSTVAWYPSAEPMRWYAILNPDGTPRPAYTALRNMRSTD